MTDEELDAITVAARRTVSGVGRTAEERGHAMAALALVAEVRRLREALEATVAYADRAADGCSVGVLAESYRSFGDRAREALRGGR